MHFEIHKKKKVTNLTISIYLGSLKKILKHFFRSYLTSGCYNRQLDVVVAKTNVATYCIVIINRVTHKHQWVLRHQICQIFQGTANIRCMLPSLPSKLIMDIFFQITNLVISPILVCL